MKVLDIVPPFVWVVYFLGIPTIGAFMTSLGIWVFDKHDREFEKSLNMRVLRSFLFPFSFWYLEFPEQQSQTDYKGWIGDLRGMDMTNWVTYFIVSVVFWPIRLAISIGSIFCLFASFLLIGILPD